MIDKTFKNKTVLILGGTGSIGTGILEVLIEKNCKKIKIFSRDEYKQHKLRYRYIGKKNIEYILGDIRDFESLNFACKGVDAIFHCAALKHVPISEEMPEEFIKTNIIGSLNIKKVAIVNKIPLVISISTDKAVNPTNVMGLTKALQEKIFSSYSLQEFNTDTRFVNVRFGNVIGTAGSFFPILYHQIKNKIPITITNPKMTRFFMRKNEAIELIFWAGENGTNGSTILRKMKATTIEEVVEGFLKILRVKLNYPVNIIGSRIGEKQNESPISEDEVSRTREKGNYFIIEPYARYEISKNIIEGKKSPNLSVKRLSSASRENQLSKKELESYIRGYIRKEKGTIQYI